MDPSELIEDDSTIEKRANARRNSVVVLNYIMAITTILGIAFVRVFVSVSPLPKDSGQPLLAIFYLFLFVSFLSSLYGTVYVATVEKKIKRRQARRAGWFAGRQARAREGRDTE